MYCCDSETTLEILLVDLLEGLIDAHELPVAQVCHHGETDLATECEKEWNLIHKTNVSRQEHLLVELQ